MMIFNQCRTSFVAVSFAPILWVAEADPAAAGDTETYVWNLTGAFQSCFTPCWNDALLVGPNKEGWYVSDVRLIVEFETFGDFDAAELVFDLLGPIVQPDKSVGINWVVSGAEMGWSGQGIFSASIHTDWMNGEIGFTLWPLHIGGFQDPPPYTGQFLLLRYEVDYSPSPAFAGDLDGDDDVDLADYELFGECVSGPEGGLMPGCEGADLDYDSDVDNADFAAFQRLFTG